jgi:NTE family protein
MGHAPKSKLGALEQGKVSVRDFRSSVRRRRSVLAFALVAALPIAAARSAMAEAAATEAAAASEAPAAAADGASGGATPAASGASAARPRLALVLSGGGARGAAHIGVLRVLEEMHVRPDIVVGTSMGAIIGGLYAAGYSPDEIEDLVKETDWKQIFIDRIDRDDRSFRRREDDATFLIPLRLRFKGWKPYIPPSFLGGQRLDLLLRSLEIRATGETDFDRLPIPYRAVAADLANGKAVILDRGSLATAMRASMSIAGMFPPVQLDGRKLIDGGAAANLAIGIAQDLGATKVIAVDITSPLDNPAELGSMFQILGQWTGYITEGNRLEDLKRLRPGDVLIQPALGDISFMAFNRAAEAIGLGEAAARGTLDDLKRFAVGDQAWAEFKARHHHRPAEETRIDEVKVVNSSWVDDRVVTHHLEIPTGAPFDDEKVRTEIMRLHGLDYFGTIDDHLDHDDGRGILTIRTPEKPYGRNSLQFGAAFSDDFAGDATYALAIRHLLLAANRRGGEWENVLQFGDPGVVKTEFYQPFDYGMRWFGTMGGELNRRNLRIWSDGSPISEYRTSYEEAHLDVGRVFDRWGDLRVGTFISNSDATLRIGSPLFPDLKDQDAGYHARFTVDTLDAVVYPTRGVTVRSLWSRSLESWGSDGERDLGYFSAGGAVTTGRVTLYPSVQGCALLNGQPSLSSSCRLGGLLHLSGLGQDELLGERSVFGSLVAYFALARLDLGSLTQGVYAGLSLETGNVYQVSDTIDWQSLLTGGSVFLGARTAIGPVYLGYGVTEGGRDNIYLVIGQRF